MDNMDRMGRQIDRGPTGIETPTRKSGGRDPGPACCQGAPTGIFMCQGGSASNSCQLSDLCTNGASPWGPGGSFGSGVCDDWLAMGDSGAGGYPDQYDCR